MVVRGIRAVISGKVNNQGIIVVRVVRAVRWMIRAVRVA